MDIKKARKYLDIYMGAVGALTNPLPYIADALGYDGDKLDAGIQKVAVKVVPKLVAGAFPEVAPFEPLIGAAAKGVSDISYSQRSAGRHALESYLKEKLDERTEKRALAGKTLAPAYATV